MSTEAGDIMYWIVSKLFDGQVKQHSSGKGETVCMIVQDSAD